MIDRTTHKPTLDAWQNSVLDAIEPFTDGCTLTVTRGRDSQENQLATIEAFARKNQCLYSEFQHGNINEKIKIWHDTQEIEVFRWQRTICALLMKGFKINGPLPYVCLEHYVRPTGEQMYGKVMSPSPHIVGYSFLATPTVPAVTVFPIDFSQKYMLGGNEVVDINFVAGKLSDAQKAGAPIRGITVEVKNGCVHTDTSRPTTVNP